MGTEGRGGRGSRGRGEGGWWVQRGGEGEGVGEGVREDGGYRGEGREME